MTQKSAILKHLKAGKTLTPLLALDYYGCFRLAARISELRNQGHSIKMQWSRLGKKRFASYRMS